MKPRENSDSTVGRVGNDPTTTGLKGPSSVRRATRRLLQLFRADVRMGGGARVAREPLVNQFLRWDATMRRLTVGRTSIFDVERTTADDREHGMRIVGIPRVTS